MLLESMKEQKLVAQQVTDKEQAENADEGMGVMDEDARWELALR